MSQSEDMNTALAAIKLCWSKGKPVICVDTDPSADPDARNAKTLLSYVVVCRYKDVTYSVLADAIKAKFNGNPTVLDAILAPPPDD